ncbi:hypothetical protein C8R46DRAFT_1043937 [Mycena filopes]|nr:hypothetical protein C8R46DRAFT_1043937 [Mycena filopes]
MSEAIADILCERFSEDRRFRLEYVLGGGYLMVTCPTSDVHRSFHSLVPCLKKIAAVNKSFVVETGIEILVRDAHAYGYKKHLPNFALGRKSTKPAWYCEYGIVVECGYSQSFPDFMDKLRRYFSVPSMQCVIVVKFSGGDLSLPGAEIPIPAAPVTRAAFSSTTPTGFGPIEFDGHTWAPVLNTITMAVYIRDVERNQIIGDDFDITPCPSNTELQESQTAIVEALHLATVRFVGRDVINAVYPGPDDFTIQWEEFYSDLKHGLVSDAYRR